MSSTEVKLEHIRVLCAREDRVPFSIAVFHEAEPEYDFEICSRDVTNALKERSMIQLKRILVPTDFSEFSKRSILYGCEFAKRFSSELHLINVVEDIYPIVPEPGIPAPVTGELLVGLKESSEQYIEALPSPEMADGVNVTRAVVSGTPFLEIIRYARENDIDMIVIGTHGRTGLIHALMGSVAEKVVRKAGCPVLTVRPEGHDFVMP